MAWHSSKERWGGGGNREVSGWEKRSVGIATGAGEWERWRVDMSCRGSVCVSLGLICFTLHWLYSAEPNQYYGLSVVDSSPRLVRLDTDGAEVARGEVCCKGGNSLSLFGCIVLCYTVLYCTTEVNEHPLFPPHVDCPRQPVFVSSVLGSQALPTSSAHQVKPIPYQTFLHYPKRRTHVDGVNSIISTYRSPSPFPHTSSAPCSCD